MTRKRRTLVLLAIIPLYGACSISYLSRTAQVNEDSMPVDATHTRLAPDPATTSEAVVQVYGARVAQWHGYFGMHTWIAVKPSNADHYTIYEVTRDSLERTGSCVLAHTRVADDLWYGNRPELLREARGPGVDALIARIESAVQRYPFAARYRIWPGPNSNTFVAYVLREVPELRVDLPATAVGKDYLGAMPFARTPSGTGGQFNLFGLLGIAAGLEEGVELNVLGLNFGVDPNSLSLKLPVLGRVGAGQAKKLLASSDLAREESPTQIQR